MKTPRESLLNRHRSANARLDRIRRDVLSTTLADGSPAPLAVRAALKFWQERMWPCRRLWIGMATVWVLIFVLKLSTHDTSRVVTRKSPVSPEVIAEVRRQKLLFAELVGAIESRAAEPPKSFSPRPRSERAHEPLNA